jgi:glycosyltransferase involved in cell wall biosynthesis
MGAWNITTAPPGAPYKTTSGFVTQALNGSFSKPLSVSSRPIKVALVGPFWPYRGGIAHFSRAMAEGLTARGHAVRAYTFSRQYPERLFPGKTQLEAGAPPADPAPRLLDTLDPRSWGRTARRIAADGAEAAVFPYWMPFFAPAFGTLARRLRRRGVTVLAVVHNALPHERRPGDRLLGRYALGACDGLVVLSDGVRHDVEALVPRVPVRQVAHPVYDAFGDPVPKAEARASLGLPPGAPVLLFFGFVRRYKGLHVLLDAMPAVLARLPDARLVVAGEFYADEAALRARAAPLGGAVRFDADYVPDEAVARYFCAADVVVQPYVSATQSGVAQIAFHFGRPVITTDVGGLAEGVLQGEAGLVVPPEDPAALADAVVRFFEEGLAARLSEGVRRARQRYGWDPLYEALEDLWTGRSGPGSEASTRGADDRG